MKQPSPTATLAAVSAIALLFAAVVMWHGGLFGTIGTIELRSGSPWRAIVVGAIAAAALTVTARSTGSTRRIRAGVALLLTSAVLALLARPSGESWPVGDAALIELNTLRALDGQLLLGAYSRFGWHHPGPLPFYWLAPFYGLAGRTSAGLVTGVLVTNIACLALVATLLMRRRHELPWFLTPALFGLLLTYLARVPSLLTSAWNPHALMFPLLALLFAAAACLHNAPGAILLVVLLASFVIQSHVSLAGVAGVLLLWCAYRLARRWRSHPGESRRIERLAVAASALLAGLWLLPLSEQIVRSPGNVTLIWRFFKGDDPTQPLVHAWRAWSTALAIVFQPRIDLAGGGRFADVSNGGLIAAGTAVFIALLVVTARAGRAGRPFVFWLGASAAAASLVGLWSVVQIRGPIGDYQIFWLSIVGTVNLAVVLGELVSHGGIATRLTARLRRHAPAVASVSAVAGLAGALIVGLDVLLLPHHTPAPRGEMDTVRDLMQQLTSTLPQSGNRQPVVRLHADMWSIGAGVVLQLKRQGYETTVIREQAGSSTKG